MTIANEDSIDEIQKVFKLINYISIKNRINLDMDWLINENLNTNVDLCNYDFPDMENEEKHSSIKDDDDYELDRRWGGFEIKTTQEIEETKLYEYGPLYPEDLELPSSDFEIQQPPTLIGC